MHHGSDTTDRPHDNPYRQPDRPRASGDYGTPLASGDDGFCLADLNALLARHAVIARNAAIVEMREPHRDALAATYDLAWQRGMEEQHLRTAGALGNRVHALLELLHLVPQLPVPDAAPILANVVELALEVVQSMVDTHGRGPFALDLDPDEIPEPETPPTTDGPDAQQADDAMRARVLQLLEWLRQRYTEPADEPEMVAGVMGSGKGSVKWTQGARMQS